MPPPEQAGDRYQLQGEIARGGMGAVLRGRDVDLGRDLAVKVLLQKYADRPEVVRRFVEEAQIGGQLQHPGVVPVYDIGRFGSRPFFTMKLVKGKTLATLLSERTEPAADRPRFLAIALQVAQTLAYAHAKGVIHRDLKPANVMVGAFGEVQVMDWGLAKVLAEGGVADEERASRERQRPEGVSTIRTARSGSAGSGPDTEAGALLGTPAYMPPEQANGDVALMDRRADVFGLGAMLCEILTGKPPYVGRSAEEVRRKAANGDLADATARLACCGGDTALLELTRSCLAPEASDRPSDAQAVADQLTAYLDGVQERLHQAELAEAAARARALEEAKRRRLTLALAATVLLALTLGGGGWLWLKTERDARLAQVTREVNDAVNRATALREQARAATVGGAALFAQAREQTQRALALVENGPAEPTLQEQVQKLGAELDEEEKDRQLLAALDEARLAQAEAVANDKFAYGRAVPLMREALRHYGLPAGEGEPAAVAARIRQRSDVVREGLLAALDEWLELAADTTLALDEPHLDWLRAVLVAAEPQDGWTRRLRAARKEPDVAKRQAALEQMAAQADVAKVPAHSLTRLASQLKAVKATAPVVRLLGQARQHYPADFWVNHNLGMALATARPPEREEAVRFLTSAVALRPESPGATLSLGLVLYDKGQAEEAITCYRRAIALDPKFALGYHALGLALKGKGQLDEAIAYHRHAIELNPKSSLAHDHLGLVLYAKGQLDEAIACHRQAIKLNAKYASTHTNLGNALAAKGQVDEAIACYHKALELGPKYDVTYTNLGLALKDKGQVDEAIACYHQALALQPKNVLAHLNLGAALADKGQLDEAIASFHQALALEPKNVSAHTNLGTALQAKGQSDAAIASYQKAMALDPKHVQAHLGLGTALKAKGQVDEAIASYQKAIALDSKLAKAHNNLGTALASKGQLDKAMACFHEAIALNPKDALSHTNLGLALAGKGQVDEAIACYRRALEVNPKEPRAHGALGQALLGQGRYAEARDATARALALLQMNHPLRAAVSGQLQTCEQWLKLEARLPTILRGEEQPASPRERLDVAQLCAQKKMPAAAVRFCTDAFAANAKLANNLQAGHRYRAACYAALAAAGQGEDAAKLDAKERARLRQQALDWLRADLAQRGKQLASGQPAARGNIQRTLPRWQQDSDLVSIRDPAALAKLSAEERAACTQLWADVAALLQRIEAAAPKEAKQ
jgi:serine/threonine-protein kinase